MNLIIEAFIIIILSVNLHNCIHKCELFIRSLQKNTTTSENTTKIIFTQPEPEVLNNTKLLLADNASDNFNPLIYII